MFERFTEQARQVVLLAQQEARELGHGSIGTEHLLLAVVTAPAGLGPRLLAEQGVGAAELRREIAQRVGGLDRVALATIGIDLDRVREAVEAAFGPGALDRTRTGSIPFTAKAKRVLELSLRESRGLDVDYIGTEHILLGLTLSDDLAAELLAERSLTHERVETLVRDALTAA
jgi:ATP-dependent Clp protease ATP-binding subunit ClpA